MPLNFLDFDFAGNFLAQSSADRFRRGPFDEVHIHKRAASKVYAVPRSAVDPEADQSSHRKQQRQDDERPHVADKVVIRFLENFHLSLRAGILMW